MAPRGRNTVFRATGIPLGEQAETLLESAHQDLIDNDDEKSAAILKEAISGRADAPKPFRQLSEDQQARAFLMAAIRVELAEEERTILKVGIEIIPCCYRDGQRSALVHFVGGDPTFTLDQKGQPKDEFQISVDSADINFDRNFYGFTQMYATEGDIEADIVAVTGLNGHSWGSWRGREKAGRMWLRDYLKEDLPHLRTMTYGYNSKLQAHSVDTILDYGLGFLEEIRKVRRTEEERERPLVLIGHSFGGLLVAHSLVKAFFRKDDDPILRATVGIIFFGVPHKGLVVTDMRRMLQDEHPRQELLDQISTKSHLLAEQLANFKNIVGDRKIISFYERQQTGRLNKDPRTGEWKRGNEFSTAVDEESALLQFPDTMEVKIPVDADHSNMVKFDSKNNQTYSSAVGHLKDVISNTRGTVNGRFFGSPAVGSYSMNILESKASNCTDVLLKKRGQMKRGTCQWILDPVICPRYSEWDKASKSDFLLITAPPGYGKSVMCSFLQEHLRYKEDSVCLFFFCDDKSEMRRTELQILRTLVYQLTHLVPRNLQRETNRIVLDMQEEVKKDENAPRELFDSCDDLWEVFLRICRAKISGLREIRCIIDALDECEPESRKSLLQRIRGFYASSTSATPSTFLKVVTSTRSYPEIISQLPPTKEVQLRGMAGVSRDVEGFIEAECSDLAGRFSLSEDFVAQLSKAMKARADGMFLWATLSMDCVRGSLQAWETRPKPWVFSLGLVPSGGLDALLAGLFHKMNPVASKALKWATLSFRPLSKDEIASIDKYESDSANRVYRTLEEHELNCSPLGYFDGQGVLHIYHQSIKDYIRKSVVKEPEDIQFFAEVCMATLTSSAAPGMGLQQYACLHWFDHIIPTLKLSDKLVHRLRDFYSPEKKCFAAWQRTFKQLPATLLISDAAMWLANNIDADTVSLTPLHLAAFCNQHDLVEKLLSSRHRRTSRVSKVLPWHNHSIWSLTRPINLKNRSGQTALCIACSRGNEAAARLLLNCNDVQADPRDDDGQTPLSFAAKRGGEAVVRLLLDRNDVQADSRNIYGRTPLSFAADGGHEAVVRLLLDRNDVQADSRNIYDRTPLSLAAARGHEAVVRLLLDRNDVQADSRATVYGRTPLSFAAEYGHEAVVRLLLDRNDVQADSRNIYGRTPLFFAADGGHEAVVRLLLDRNDVQADSRHKYGQTPLSSAAFRGHEAVVRLLLDRNDVQADSRDTVYGRTPLSCAARHGHEAVVRLLLDHNDVQADSRDDNGRTPLSWVARCGHEAVVRLLLERNDVQADSRDDDGQTPLSFAAEGGHEAVVRLLLDRNDVQADSQDKYGRTPLSFAARHGHEAVVRLLLDRNDVQADSRSKSGRTPLSFAAEDGHEAVVRLLLNRNEVQADSRDDDGRTPLSLAAEGGHEAVVRLLRDRCFNISGPVWIRGI